MFEVWRWSNYGHTLVREFRWRWLARLYAWERTKRGWFRYEVREPASGRVSGGRASTRSGATESSPTPSRVSNTGDSPK